MMSNEEFIAALIGASVALIGILFRDIIFKLWHERRHARKTAFTIFRKYADPLASSSTSLLWRLHEICYHPGRGSYLKEPKTEFEHYKKISTLYRIASLLGWTRAFGRELTFLQIHQKKHLRAFEKAIDSFISALADGPHIENRRIRELATLWNLPLTDDQQQQFAAGIALNNVIKRKLHSEDVGVATLLTDKSQNELCEEAANVLCDHFNIQRLTQPVLQETRAQAIQRVAIREAWLYRDWQAGIGDLMIKESTYGDRAFEIIGYREFESIFLSEDEEQKRWIGRLNNLIDELDISGEDRFDARVQQLRNTMKATAELVIALADIQPRHRVISEQTLETAKKILDKK